MPRYQSRRDLHQNLIFNHPRHIAKLLTRQKRIGGIRRSLSWNWLELFCLQSTLGTQSRCTVLTRKLPMLRDAVQILPVKPLVRSNRPWLAVYGDPQVLAPVQMGSD